MLRQGVDRRASMIFRSFLIAFVWRDAELATSWKKFRCSAGSAALQIGPMFGLLMFLHMWKTRLALDVAYAVWWGAGVGGNPPGPFIM